MTEAQGPPPPRRRFRRRPEEETPESGVGPAANVERLVDEALAALPRQYADHLDNVVIVVRREPGPRERASLRLRRGQTLYGLYQGIPVTRRDSGYHLAAPDKITIYWLPLVRDFSAQRLADQVKKTVFHEIAHHFGISDQELHHTSVG